MSSMITRNIHDLEMIIVHCSDSDNPDHANVATIRQWHLERGFSDIGYHYVINDKGIYQGRSLDVVGAHCKGFNKNSIGICLTGKNNFTPSQFMALGVLIENLTGQFGIKKVYRHCDLDSNKTCPNFDSYVFNKPDIKTKLNLV